MTAHREPSPSQARAPRSRGLARAGTARGKPGDGRRDSSWTAGRRWTSATSAPAPSPIPHRESPPSGSPQASLSEEVEPSVVEGFPHIHRPYYFY